MLCIDHRRLAAALLIMSAPAAVLIPTMTQAAVPGSTASVNVDQAGLGLRGFDPVAYFDTGKPTKGVDAISTMFNGARYLFATDAHRRTFLADPAKYVPQFGGFCAVGTSFGEKVDADPQTGRIVDGKLYVNYNAKTQVVFDNDVRGTIARAEQNWPKVKDKAQ